ncbi:MAG: Glu-tRNA(Gln) amidotransferase subunit GatE [Nanoarchaeota archaeon]|nr:Glu-tRNA(Gln) amidotransferase subunit GatE [Nanoarchaeota archaeon]
MSDEELNYKELGLKCGLEIHQQLNSDTKLFCRCPSVLRKDEPDFLIRRKLHAVAGESGEVDVAAAYQTSLGKEFEYQCYHDVTCLVELDEEPPREINRDALKIALQISILLNAKIIPLTQIMRKTVVDGSNTSGFQRTILIARDGWVETEEGRVGIETICLEEDSARIVSSGDSATNVFKLDRLGIPLIEIATKPDIKNPEQAKEVALHLGEILRSCNVRRGLGTIRQDVNLSVKNGERIELKGFQDIRNIESAIEKEVGRQVGLVKNGKSVSEVRKVLSDGKSEFLRPMPSAARMYPETDLLILKISRDLINDAKKTLPKLKGDVEKELEKEGLSREMISLLLKQNKVEEFKELLGVVKNPALVAKVLLVFPKEIAKREKMPLNEVEEKLTKDVLTHVLDNLKRKKISEGDVKNVLEKIVKGEDYVKAVKVEKHASLNEVEEKIMSFIKNKPGLSTNAYMGLVMKEFKGGVDGKVIMEIIKKYLK